jgi:hypothetical protein
VKRELLVSLEAHADLAEAVGGFRDISPQLVVRFGIELERIYSLILEYPQMYPVVHKNFRRALIRRFPYSVFYIQLGTMFDEELLQPFYDHLRERCDYLQQEIAGEAVRKTSAPPPPAVSDHKEESSDSSAA